MLQNIGKILILFGVVFIVGGSLLFLAGKFNFLGKLPGDIIVRHENITFYFPFTTCILISLLVSIILFLFSRR